ncbi:MAG: 4-hydroxy-tetrahydrodipicolinate reductase [Holosporaceae bacterium]|jgi:4-hydroxy-tetrahydrodipicolinate reductase|nr:4-hydroxy-tetrahydrodipicolinate reductase [Holosporaceae bacterium]
MDAIKIGIIGVSGRMGSLLSALISKSEQGGGSCSKTSSQELDDIVRNSDVLLDFSSPPSTIRAIVAAVKFRKPVVSGTTGLSDGDFARLKEFSTVIPILHASNFCLGIHLMADLIEKCSTSLPDFDFSIIDRHHRGKQDAPSGTSLFLANYASQKAQIVSLREGNVFGEHSCDFAGENEMLSITHRAFNREVFAVGALRCAHWIIGKIPRLYSMRDYIRSINEREMATAATD